MHVPALLSVGALLALACIFTRDLALFGPQGPVLDLEPSHLRR
jgi:hypothetical protein